MEVVPLHFSPHDRFTNKTTTVLLPPAFHRKDHLQKHLQSHSNRFRRQGLVVNGLVKTEAEDEPSDGSQGADVDLVRY